MRPLKNAKKPQALYHAKAKAAAGKTTKRAKMVKRRDYLERFYTERERVQRHYCTLFGFWQFCGLKACHRARACKGDQDACLKRSVGRVPVREQLRARAELLKATPSHIGKAELKVRQTEPTEFWRRPVDPAVREALARAKEEREEEKRFGIGLGRR